MASAKTCVPSAPCGRDWIDAAEIEDGRVFRSVSCYGYVGPALRAAAVADVVKHYARRAGRDEAESGGHSLRAGFVTSAAERGAKSGRIMAHTGHQSAAMVRVYTRRSDTFVDHAGEGLL